MDLSATVAVTVWSAPSGSTLTSRPAVSPTLSVNDSGRDLDAGGFGRQRGRQHGLALRTRIRAIDRAIHNSDHLTGLAVYLTVQGEHGPTERKVYHRGAFNNRFRVRAGYLVSTLKA